MSSSDKSDTAKRNAVVRALLTRIGSQPAVSTNDPVRPYGGLFAAAAALDSKISQVEHPTGLAVLGQLVRSTREASGQSQTEFAALSGVGRRFLSELENGKPTLEIGKVMQVLAAAGIDLFARKR